MLITKTVKVKWHYQNKEWYENLGYQFHNKYGEELEVNIHHLPRNSRENIQCLCDYCLEKGVETILTKRYKSYLDSREKIPKDCCPNCKTLKTKESNMKIYGVENVMQLEENVKKLSDSINNKYNVKYISQLEEIKQVKINKSQAKYGCDNVLQSPEVQNKIKNTNIQKYGYENAAQSQEIQEKTKKTNLKRYGTEYTTQNIDIIRKMRESLYKNGNVQTSNQQRYLHNLLGGKLNYPVDLINIDIAYPDKLIGIEYDGSGHNLNVKLNKITNQEFINKENRRTNFLLRRGWKLIFIISKKDNLPNDNIILKMINEAIDLFAQLNMKFIKYNIDNKTIQTNKYIEEYEYGKLRKINRKDVTYVS